MMSFYAGHHTEAEALLRRTALLGLESKIFDCQSLVLMAFVQFERGDHKALQRCIQDFERLREKNPHSERLRRLAHVTETLSLLLHHKIAQALVAVRDMTQQVRRPDFDFEAATNLLGLLAQLAKRAIQLEEVHLVVEHMAVRFCSSRAMSELLANAAKAHPEYADHVRVASAKVLKYAEYAMSLSLGGDPKAAVEELLLRGQETLNTKLMESAAMVLERYSAKIGDTQALQARVQTLRSQCVVEKSLAEDGPRKAGALSLRVGAAAKKAQAV
jgi:hypothetical protein